MCFVFRFCAPPRLVFPFLPSSFFFCLAFLSFPLLCPSCVLTFPFCLCHPSPSSSILFSFFFSFSPSICSLSLSPSRLSLPASPLPSLRYVSSLLSPSLRRAQASCGFPLLLLLFLGGLSTRRAHELRRHAREHHDLLRTGTQVQARGHVHTHSRSGPEDKCKRWERSEDCTPAPA